MRYENRQYWPEIHERLKGQLKAVGHPFLSEELNRLKYRSEAATMEQALREIMATFQKNNQRQLSFLDIGAGTGFWTDIISSVLASNGYQADVSALDVSQDALDVIKERYPHVHRLQADLATISPDQFAGTYDLVTSCYCVHHIVRTNDFINAFQFAGSSVKQGGFLFVMDPVLMRPYSKFDSFDFYSYEGNGVPRHLYFLDDILSGLGLKRRAVYPAVSFLLNGCIEAQGPLGYFFMNSIWKVLCVLYRSERFVRSTAGLWQGTDAILKNTNLAFSSSLCVYQKLGPDAVNKDS